MAYFRYIISTTSLVLFTTTILFTTTGPACCLAETFTTADLTVTLDDSSSIDDHDSNATDLTPSEHQQNATNGHQQLPRPIVTLLDTSQVQPKRMKHKVTIKRRKHGAGGGQQARNKTTTATASTSTGSNKNSRPKKSKRKPTMQSALQTAARKGLEAMVELYDRREPEMLRKGDVLEPNDPGAMLAKFSSSDETPEHIAKAGYAALVAAKQLKESTNVEYVAIGRQAPPKISLKRTPLEGMCPSRDPPPCVPASRRYRTHDGTCNNRKRPRWGAAQMPFHRFLAPEYADGVEGIRRSIHNTQLPSARFVSLVVHGTRQEEAPVTMMLALWGQLLDHDLTATAQPRSLNGSTPRCCGKSDDGLHPSCLPIKVPLDDPWLSPLGVRCLEFLRSAPAQRRDCLLSWREQTNQVTSYIDASPIYSSNPRTSDNARIFRSGMLLFGRGPPSEDVCFRAALANQCIRPGDARSGEQPGLLMLHMVWVNEHNQIATRLSDINPHWSDEKLYQETRRIVGAMFQHISYREFLPVILGKEVSRLFNLDLETSGFYKGYDPGVNPTVANEFSAAAFRFGHSLIQGSYMRADRHHRFIPNNVTLHEETADGDLGGPGSLHRLVRGMVNQRALKRDEFITAELTNHLFQTRSFPFGLDLAAINIQRGRDHGIQPYVNWRIPCGLTPIKDWDDLDRVSGPASAHRLRKAYRSVDDIDLFVGGLAERPVVGGVVGPTFSCIIAQQFSNLRKGDRFWYENPGFESSFTPAQLESIRQVAFSQVLCRALGGGTLQPHVFLPADNGQNERLPCDSKLMAPIDLEPWTERDPFTRPSDSPNEPGQSDNLIDLDALQAIATATSTSTTRRPQPTKAANVINKVDFIPNGHTGLQIPSNGQIVLNSPRPQTTVVNNKLDLILGTQPTPARPAQQNKPTTAIDNKLDLTTVPPKRKPTRKTTTKRRPTPSSNLVVNNLDFSLKRDSLDNTTMTSDETVRLRRDVTFINLSKLFTREDNATLPKNNPALRRGYYPAPTDPPSDYDDVNNYDYGDGPVYVKPGYGYGPPETEPPPPNPYYYSATEEPPPQPPYCGYNCYQPPMTTYNPYGQDTRKPARTTPKRGQPSKIITPNNDHDPQKRRTTSRPQQLQLQQQQQRTTTQRTVVLRPGLVVINDNRPPTNNNRPNDKPIFLSPSSSSSSLNSFPQNSKNPSPPSSVSQSVFSVDPRPQFSPSRPSQPQLQSVPSPIFSQRKPNFKKPPKELRTDLPTRISAKHDYDYDSLVLLPDDGLTSNIHEHDGYLRPEQNLYEPLKKTSDLETYRNYSSYNDDRRSQTAAPYYEVPTGRVLWTDNLDNLGRYAQQYQLHETDDDRRDQFVGPYIDSDKKRLDTTTTLTVTSKPDLTEATEWNDTEDNDDEVDETILTEDVEQDAHVDPPDTRQNEDSTSKLSTKLNLTDAHFNLDEHLDFPDIHARTSNKDPIQSLLPDPDSNIANKLPKLPRFDQQDAPTTTTTPTGRTTKPSRKRRPTRPKRPTTSIQTSDRRQPGIALVPFVLLTSIERPDNWVMFNVAKSKKRNPLPEVPQLKSDVFSLSELPKPIAEED